ncbi:MAG: glutamate synthase subunit beta [Thermoleophilaceae bacterium]
MGDLRGFLNIERAKEPKRDPGERLGDYRHVLTALPVAELRDRGARCMDCGVPFCHEGCPLGNLIPDWNDLVYRDRWREALDQLHATNNFPELTGQICPAPCESACVLDINDDAVTIKQIELAIVNRGFEEGWIVAEPPEERTGRRVAVVGSGPAGMAVAAELNKAGHTVVVFERDETAGGLNRFGVPDFKLEKWVIDRRIALMEEEGVEFRCGVDVGSDVSADDLRGDYDAVVVATGSRVPRGLEAPGSDLGGIHRAMDYLYQRNRWVAAREGRPFRDLEPADMPGGEEISAAGKHVVVVGGGDTGMDCIANAHREGPASVTQIDTYAPVPEDGRYAETPWPEAPKRTPTTYALDEGGDRRFESTVTEFEAGEDGRVGRAHVAHVRGKREVVEGSEQTIAADLVLVAIGFTHPEHEGALAQLGVELDDRGNVHTEDWQTSVEGVFACGDARRGQSLTVWAIAEGRICAAAVDRHLCGSESVLERQSIHEATSGEGVVFGPPAEAVTPA